MTKKALISPNETTIEYISSWTVVNDKHEPVITAIPNACRIAQVVEIGEEFDVAPPLHWKDCTDDVETGYYYFNTENDTIIKIPEHAQHPDQV